MMFYIENDFVKAAFSEVGAELCSLVLKENQKEYIWQADEKIWGRHAPLLFPIIGRLKDKEYTLDGKTYTISQHGFARESVFRVAEQTADSITFVLEPNAFSAEMYPFCFELQVCYALQGNTLKKTHTFINHDDKALYYEVGGHDGYNLCLEEGECMEDYYLDFGDAEAIYPLCMDENILLLKDTYRIPLENGKLPIRMELFKQDALVLHDIPTRLVQIKSTKSDRCISFEFKDFKTIGIWTKYLPENTNYICLEPWSTLPDCAYLGKELEQKIDIRRVEAGAQESLSFSVTIQ